LIVDIRAPEEWAQTGVIEGAKLVTFTDPDSFLAAVGGDLADGRDLVLICHSGRRSGLAAEALAGRVPNRIISAQGGMAAVIGAGYQTVAPE
jgi:rhodanese-related sulfurtransferase